MNFFKKFLLYFFIIVGSVVAIVAVILAIMYFAPGTQILNYKYLNYNQVIQEEFTAESKIKPTDFVAVEVNTKLTQVYFMPSDKEGIVSYSHRQGLSGFVRAETSSLYVSANVVEKSYSEEVGGTTYKTLVLNVIEPEGVMISENNPMLTVYLPLELEVLSVNTEKGRVGFSTKNNEASCIAKKFYANSTQGGEIQIDYPKGATNYYLYTTTGDVTFNYAEVVDASIKLTTDTGKLSFVNSTQTPTLTGNLEVYSFVENKGPTIDFGNIKGNVKIAASYVNFKAQQIGAKEAQTSLAVTVDKSDMDLGSVYARFTLASKVTKNHNNVTIKRLYYTNTTDSHILDVGSGNVNITDSIGNVGIDATTGNVVLANAYDDIKVATTTGPISVTYNSGAQLDGVDRVIEGDLTIDTETGDVVVNNLRGALNVKVSSLKAEGKMDIHFLDMKKDTYIKAGGRNVSIGITYIAAIQGGGIGRLLLVNGYASFGLGAGTYSTIVSGDEDFIEEPKYNSEYRVGYAKSASDTVYTQGLYDGIYGKVVIETTGKTNVNAKQ